MFWEFVSNNIDTSTDTNKQYCKIILFYKFLSNKTGIFRELLPYSTNFFHRRCTRQYFVFSQMWTYSKSLLSVLIAKSTFRKVFDFKKLKIRYCWNTSRPYFRLKEPPVIGRCPSFCKFGKKSDTLFSWDWFFSTKFMGVLRYLNAH